MLIPDQGQRPVPLRLSDSSGVRLFTFVCHSPVMTTQRGVLGPATSRWSDYVGTAAADDAEVVLNTPSLYELAAVDRQRWRILGIDLASEQGETRVTVYAFDRTQHSSDSLAELDKLGRDTGAVPVRAFPVPAEQVDHFLDKAFRRVLIRLVAQPVRNLSLVVDDPGVPEQVGAAARP